MKAPLISLCFGVAVATSTPLRAAEDSGVQAEQPATVFPGASWETKRPEEAKLAGGSLDEFARRVGGDGCIVKDGFLVKTWGNFAQHKDWAQIGLARSRDGISHWQRHPANPIISPGPGRWDHDACYKPFAIFDEEKSQWLLWYNGRRGRTEQIGLAIHPGRDLGFPALDRPK